MIQPQDFLVGVVALGLAAASFVGIVLPAAFADRWSIAKFTQMRFGNTGVRILFAILASIMAVVAFQLLMIVRK
jgi:hypothetical protein